MLFFYLTLIDEQTNKDKFEKIYLLYKNLMLNVAFKILKDKHEAEDAAHNAFLRILKNIDTIGKADDTKTKAFIVIVTENVAKTMYTKRKKLSVVPLDETIAKTHISDSDFENKFSAEIIAQKIHNLPQNYKDVLMLKYANDLPDKKIALALGISNSNVRKRLQRARTALYNQLKDSDQV